MSTAFDDVSAVERAGNDIPDAILMDIGLPGMNGYAVAQEIRKSEKGKATLLVAISGYGQEEDRRRSIGAGFDFHLVKPVDFGTLSCLLSERIPNASGSES